MTSCSIEIVQLMCFFIYLLQKDPRLLQLAAEDVLDTMIDEIILGVITFFFNQCCGSESEKAISGKVFLLASCSGQ
jgi:hypothetical protein